MDACHLNLARDNVKTYWKAPDGAVFGHFGSLTDWLQERGEKLVCASNAGIYGKDLRPLGLYIEAGRVLHKLNTRKEAYGNFYLQPNGVLLLTEYDARIVTTETLAVELDNLLPSIRYAVQSGPILLLGGEINSLFAPGSENRLLRNAVCVTSGVNIVLAKSRSPINFHDFAKQLRDALGCRDALYLDGSISQLYPFDNSSFGPSFGAMIGATVPAQH